MTDIIQMARDVGFCAIPNDIATEETQRYVCDAEQLKRFAELVRADEREACARVCEQGITRLAGYDSLNRAECAKAIRARGEG